MLEINKVYNMDCVEGMKLLDTDSIDLVVTSPPYDRLRKYDDYVTFDFFAVVPQLARIMKPGGVVVWVVGDATVDGSETGTSFRQALYFMEEGFNLHDTMIYEKSGSPYPSKTRYNQLFEYMFIFSKGKPKSISLIKDKKNKWGGTTTRGNPSFRQTDGTLQVGNKRVIKEYGIRDNIWRYHNGAGYGSTDKLAKLHPATFPEKLAEDHIITWSNVGDLVLDPFMGSGTTAKMATKTGRNWIGFDISNKYCEIAEERAKV